MWTETTRRQYRREDLRYASDMTDAEWALIEPHLPAAKRLGRPRRVPLRAVVEALLYLLRTASPWRLLPRDFPNRSTVQRYFYAWQAAGLWETINFLLLQQARERAGREASPSAGVIDSQSAKRLARNELSDFSWLWYPWCASTHGGDNMWTETTRRQY